MVVLDSRQPQDPTMQPQEPPRNPHREMLVVVASMQFQDHPCSPRTLFSKAQDSPFDLYIHTYIDTCIHTYMHTYIHV